MRTFLPVLGLLLALSACHVSPPELPLHEMPAGPLLEKLSERRTSFVGMKAAARVSVERSGRKRVYESVAVLQRDFRKLKVEAYGPLGEPLVALLWDGNDVLVRKPGDTEPTKVGQFGLERLLGISVAPADLCALLSGNVPAAPAGIRPRAGCFDDGRCVIDIRSDEGGWRITFAPAAGEREPAVRGADLYRGNRVVLHSSFDPQGWSSASGVPKGVLLEDPERKTRLVVEYEGAEAGIPVEDGVFTLSPEEEQRK